MIKINDVTKQFDTIKALDSISCTLDEKRVVLFGPSGSGKTTLLRILASLDRPTSGTIEMKDVHSISMVFQKDYLLDHLNAFENIAYGMDQSKISKEEIENRVIDIAKVCHVDSYLYQKVKTLSGGQRQRVSLARALVKNPDMLLMDEAFSSLDQNLKKELMNEVLKIQEKQEIQLVYVTHDPSEAVVMGQQFIFIKDGKIEKNTDTFNF